MAEKKYEQILRSAIIAKNGLCLKFTCISFTGVPDRLCILPGGRIFFVEMKDNKGVLSERQKYVINLLQSLGCEVYVVYGEQVYEFCRNL